jgi:hypothetical protein
MLGHMSGGPRIIDTGTPTGEKDCLLIFQKTHLLSPTDVVDTLSRDNILEVELWQEDGRERLYAIHEGAIAGVLMPKLIVRIKECIKSGVEYIAVVLEKNGGRCLVEIRPKAAK